MLMEHRNTVSHLRRMESIVENVEDERQYEGTPANSQSGEDSGGWDGMGISLSVNHSDGLSSCSGHHQGHHCQTERINENIVYSQY